MQRKKDQQYKVRVKTSGFFFFKNKPKKRAERREGREGGKWQEPGQEKRERWKVRTKMLKGKRSRKKK